MKTRGMDLKRDPRMCFFYTAGNLFLQVQREREGRDGCAPPMIVDARKSVR